MIKHEAPQKLLWGKRCKRCEGQLNVKTTVCGRMWMWAQRSLITLSCCCSWKEMHEYFNTPGQLGATFRCISPGPCASPMWHGWMLKLANVHKVKVYLSTFCPYGWMEISMQTAVGCQAHKMSPYTYTVHTNTCIESVHGSVQDLLKSEKTVL